MSFSIFKHGACPAATFSSFLWQPPWLRRERDSRIKAFVTEISHSHTANAWRSTDVANCFSSPQAHTLALPHAEGVHVNALQPMWVCPSLKLLGCLPMERQSLRNGVKHRVAAMKESTCLWKTCPHFLQASNDLIAPVVRHDLRRRLGTGNKMYARPA